MCEWLAWTFGGHNEMAQWGGGRKNAVVGELMLARVGQDGDEALDERERLEDDGAGAIAPRGAQFPEDIAILGDGESALGEWGLRDVPAQALAQGVIPFADQSGCVQRVAIAGAGECRSRGCVSAAVAFVGRVDDARNGLAGFRA